MAKKREADPDTKRFISCMAALLEAEYGRENQTIADSAGISRSYLSEIKSGKKIPTYDIQVRIAKAMNRSREDMAKVGMLPETRPCLKDPPADPLHMECLLMLDSIFAERDPVKINLTAKMLKAMTETQEHSSDPDADWLRVARRLTGTK